MSSINKQGVVTTFRFLNHDGYTELRCISPSEGLIAQEWVESKEMFLKFCKEHDGEGNVYVGINPRFEEGGSSDSIKKITTIPIDIDAVTPWEETEKKEHQAASEDELQKAIDAAEKIISDLKNMGLTEPLRIMSGNGVQLWYRIPDVKIDKYPNFEIKVKEFINQLDSKYTLKYLDDNRENQNFCSGIELDQVGDTARVMKVAGTKSVKGMDTQARPMRRARVMGEPSFVKDEKLKDFILGLEPPEKEEEETSELGDETNLEFWRKVDNKLDDLLSGDWSDYGFKSRSEAEFSLIVKLVKYGFNQESIQSIMDNVSEIGKWKSESENYRGRTINNAIDVVENVIDVHDIDVSGMYADLVGEYVEVTGQVVGEIDKKALPRELFLVCSNCGGAWTIDLRENDDVLNAFIFGNKTQKKGALKSYMNKQSECENSSHSPSWDTVNYMDYNIVYVRDTFESIDKFSQSVYKPRVIHIIDDHIPSTKVIKARGKVSVDNNDNLVIISPYIREAEDEISTFELAPEDKDDFEEYFNDIDEIKYNIAPNMVKRDNLRIARLLSLHSVIEIPDIEDTRTIRGNVNEMLIGDSKTYKSQSFEDLSEDYSLGELVMAETSSRTGLLYTIDTEKDALIWGALVTSDKKYLTLDGMHCMDSDEISQFREAISKQKVKVRRMKSGAALARTRISASANPKNPVGDYPHKCNAIMDTKTFEEPPDVTRYDLFLVLAEGDVSDHEIATRKTSDTNIPDEIFRRHVLWAWNLVPEDIVYTDEAKEKIIEETEYFIDSYRISELPIVHSGAREVITRLSVSWAVMLHSVDDNHERVIVDYDHVDGVTNFYEEILQNLELGVYKDYVEGEKRISDEELVSIVSEVDDVDLEILEVVKYEYKPSREIAEQIGSSPSTVRKRTNNLKVHNLLQTDKRKGEKITPKGVSLFRMMASGEKDRMEEMIEDLKEICPVEKEKLVDKFGEDLVSSMFEDDMLIERDDGTIDVRFEYKF